MQWGSDPAVFSAFKLCKASAKRLLPKTLKAKSSCEQLGDVRELDAALALAWQAEQLCDHPFSPSNGALTPPPPAGGALQQHQGVLLKSFQTDLDG